MTVQAIQSEFPPIPEGAKEAELAETQSDIDKVDESTKVTIVDAFKTETEDKAIVAPVQLRKK